MNAPHRSRRSCASLGSRLFAWFALTLALAACDRVKEPEGAPAHPARGTPGPLSDPGVSAPSGKARAEPCLVELPAAPAPPAKPARDCPADPETSPPAFGSGRVTFPDAPGRPSLELEVADTPAEHARGLMHRTSLPPSRGMLFAWSDEGSRVFWMKNTCIPLDMLFLARDGTVVGVVEQVPVLNDAPRSVPCPAAYVLEANAGWTRKHGVRPGMKATLSL